VRIKAGWGDPIRSSVPIRERKWYFHDDFERTVYHEPLPPEDESLDLSEIISLYFLLWLEDHFCELAASDLAPWTLAGMG
jgi:hypothetical protein